VDSIKPRVFIGSSTEGLAIADAIQKNLEYYSYVDLWTQGIFEPSSTSLDDLIMALNQYDFAIFVFMPEDVVKMRLEEYAAVRDNVIFETGLFIGRNGKNRTFYIAPRGKKFRLPSDLAGFSAADYDDAHPNLNAALGPACTAILAKMKREGPIIR